VLSDLDFLNPDFGRIESSKAPGSSCFSDASAFLTDSPPLACLPARLTHAQKDQEAPPPSRHRKERNKSPPHLHITHSLTHSIKKEFLSFFLSFLPSFNRIDRESRSQQRDFEKESPDLKLKKKKGDRANLGQKRGIKSIKKRHIKAPKSQNQYEHTQTQTPHTDTSFLL